MLLEVAAASVLVGSAAGRPALVPACLTAVALVAAVAARHRGRPLLEWSGAALAMRGRRRRAGGAPPGPLDPVLAPLAECEPALRTYAFAGRGGRSVGMVGDGTFLTAVLVVRAEDEPLRRTRPLPLGPLHDALEVEDVRLASVQVVQQIRPAAVRQGLSPDGAVPRYGLRAVRGTWVALRLDPELCSTAVLARGGGVGGAQRAVLRAADHLASRLLGAGFAVAVLDEEELTAALAASACVGAPGADPVAAEGPRAVEHSRAWHCGGRRHTTYGLGDVPAAAEAMAALTSVPATAYSFALTLARGPGGAPLVAGFLRVTAEGDTELASAWAELEAVARRRAVELTRLDHEQLPGLLATLPLGGTR
ncbi:type VII secretion protein EccE [Streptomyces sp. NPDC020983]|uniref:type VII secretion protein EccE n=1 Tax=Streptomyces sp. NPDC020983 TaxID=3365106 RepID=UPI0037ACC9E0